MSSFDFLFLSETQCVLPTSLHSQYFFSFKKFHTGFVWLKDLREHAWEENLKKKTLEENKKRKGIK